MNEQKKIKRIVLLNLDSFVSNAGITKLIEVLQNRIVLICSSQRFGGKYGSFIHQLNITLRRSGLNFVIYQSINLIIYHVAIAISDFLSIVFGCKKRVFSSKQEARKFGIPYIKIKEINNPNILSRIKRLNPELIISFYFDQVIRTDLIKIPSLGILNLHNAKLPKCRGPFPIFCSIINEIQGGITIHAIDNETLDTGKIYEQYTYEIDTKKDIMSVDRESLIFGANNLIELISRLEKNGIKGVTQESNGTYMSYPTKKDIKNIKKREIKLFSIREFIKAF